MSIELRPQSPKEQVMPEVEVALMEVVPPTGEAIDDHLQELTAQVDEIFTAEVLASANKHRGKKDFTGDGGIFDWRST